MSKMFVFIVRDHASVSAEEFLSLESAVASMPDVDFAPKGGYWVSVDPERDVSISVDTWFWGVDSPEYMADAEAFFPHTEKEREFLREVVRREDEYIGFVGEAGWPGMASSLMGAHKFREMQLKYWDSPKELGFARQGFNSWSHSAVPGINGDLRFESHDAKSVMDFLDRVVGRPLKWSVDQRHSVVSGFECYVADVGGFEVRVGMGHP